MNDFEGGTKKSLNNARPGYIAKVKDIRGSEKIRKFLFTLGCSEGEEITLISKLGANYIIRVKDNRYAIDKNMAMAIEIA